MTVIRWKDRPPPNPLDVMREQFADSIERLGYEIARAEEALICRAIELAGYDPVASPDAEWTKHVTIERESQHSKVIHVDGTAKYRIVAQVVYRPHIGASSAHYVLEMGPV